MIKIESATLEEAYKDAASSLECSVTELKIEVVQYPSKGVLGLFKKTAIIVAMKEAQESDGSVKASKEKEPKAEVKQKTKEVKKEKIQKNKEDSKQTILNDTIMPASFVSTQDDDESQNDETLYSSDILSEDMSEIVKSVKKDINELFSLICFNIDEIEVSAYDENTLLIELKGEDAALLIGKEGYRYKALSYMIFNWINSKYQLQIRLEIAEFLKNQEESISRYLVGVCESIDRDGRAQTKILDGVLVQIALKELRERYPEKYVAIRSTRDGMKYIIINDYHAN